MKKLFNYTILLLIPIGMLALIEFGSGLAVKRMNPALAKEKDLVESPFHPYLGWTHPPNAKIDTTIDYLNRPSFIMTDENGFSDTPLKYEKPDLKVVFLGGSTIFGVGASDNRGTVPSRLEQVFAKAGIKAEVVNLGVRGYNSFQEMLLLNDYLAEHEADLVVALSGRNDAYQGAALKNVKEFFHRRGGQAEVIRKLERGELTFVGVKSWLARHSNIYRLLISIKMRADAQNNPAVQPDPEGFSNIAERVRITDVQYNLVNTICKYKEIEFVMFLQPVSFTKADLTEEEKKFIKLQYEKYGPDWLEYQRKYLAGFYDAFRKLPKNYEFVDLSDSFDPSSTGATSQAVFFQ